MKVVHVVDNTYVLLNTPDAPPSPKSPTLSPKPQLPDDRDEIALVPQLEQNDKEAGANVPATSAMDNANDRAHPIRSYLDQPIKLHRGHVFDEMITWFEKSDVIPPIVEIKLVHPNGSEEMGEDNGGVLRDALAEFWGSFYETCTVGNSYKVPAIRHNMTTEKWKACARVLLVGYKQQGYIPIQLAPPFLEAVFDNSATAPLDEESLLDAFKHFVPEIEKDLIEDVLKDFDSVEEDELMDFSTAHAVRVIITKNNVRDVICEVAHKELIQAPSFVVLCWQDIVQDKVDARAVDMRAKLMPTTKKVLNILTFPQDMNEEERCTAVYLKSYVKGLSKETLQCFLRFATGSDLMVVPGIAIRFVKQSEFERRPVAHTCGCVLELATSYETLMDFRAEFNAVLDSGVLSMDFV